MAAAKTVGIRVTKFALAAGFLGLGVLGAVLIAMAVLLSGPIPKRIAVFVLGVGGIVIAGGFVRITRNRSREQST